MLSRRPYIPPADPHASPWPIVGLFAVAAVLVVWIWIAS